MGWWPSSLFSKDDPLKDLDPTLREYLQTSSPSAYNAAAKTDSTYARSRDDKTYRDQLQLKSDNVSPISATQRDQPEENTRPLPKESLFQDGRYAHIWATYRPAVEVEAAGKSDQEKLNDIVGGFKERRDAVKHVALENCANEQWNIHNCFKNGGWTSRMTMCRDENRALERCVIMQSKFLRALGYLSPYQRTAEETERIQMHADTLYHRMLEQEEAIETARQRGEPLPQFEELIREDRGASNMPVFEDGEVRPRVGRITFETLPKEIKEKLAKERFTGLSGPALEVAKKELNQEIASNEAVIGQLEEHWRRDKQQRQERRERGEERMSDKVMRWFDFRDYDTPREADSSRK